MTGELAPAGHFEGDAGIDRAMRVLAHERSRTNAECYRLQGMRRSHSGDLYRFLKSLAEHPEKIRRGRFYGVDLEPPVRDVFDHIRLYTLGRRPYAVILHPYARLDLEAMQALVKWAEEVGVGMVVDADSEYYPGVTLRIAIYRRGTGFPVTDMV